MVEVLRETCFLIEWVCINFTSLQGNGIRLENRDLKRKRDEKDLKKVQFWEDDPKF